MTIHLYGIPICDKVKAARAWLAERDFAYAFHDYKEEGVDPLRLRDWSGSAGWEALLNRRGMTFRNLPEQEKEDLEESKAVRLMQTHPSLIKRPVLEHDGGLLVGFDDNDWAAILA